MTQLSLDLPAPMTALDVAMSERVRCAVHAQYARCFLNAWRALALPELVDAFYVEGYVVSWYGQVGAHGWLELAGLIVEPTYPARDRAPFAAFYPAIKYDRREAQALGTPPFSWRLYGHGHPALLGAYMAACEAVVPGYMTNHYVRQLEAAHENTDP